MRAYPSRRYDPSQPEPTIEIRSRTVDPKLAQLAYYLDQLFRIPGTAIRFGIDPIIGFILPGAGDALTALISAYIVIASVRYGLPKIVIGRMIFNIAADFLLGSVPLVGDLFDFTFKSNKKNLELLNRHAGGQHRTSFSDWAWLVVLLATLGALVVGSVLLIITVVSKLIGHG
jgi:hypothetical protein